MKFKDLFEKWNLSSLKVKTPILELNWEPGDADKDAAWEMYIELVTRIATQPLLDGDGVEASALNSVYSLFPSTREILKNHGRKAVNFSRIAVIVLNQIVRPFTTKWHLRSEREAFKENSSRDEFRKDLAILRANLLNYSALLAEVASVEDMTFFELYDDAEETK